MPKSIQPVKQKSNVYIMYPLDVKGHFVEDSPFK